MKCAFGGMEGSWRTISSRDNKRLGCRHRNAALNKEGRKIIGVSKGCVKLSKSHVTKDMFKGHLNIKVDCRKRDCERMGCPVV